MARDFQGVYRLLVGTLRPQWLLAWAPRQYKRYFRGGEAIAEEARAGYGRWRLDGCYGFDRSLWMDMQGSCEAILEACGAEALRGRVAEGGRDGDAHAVLEFFWL